MGERETERERGREGEGEIERERIHEVKGENEYSHVDFESE